MIDALMFEELGGLGRADVIRLRGRLDARTSPLLMERCAGTRDQGRHMVLNLSGISFLASSGIGALLALTEEFREHGATLCLAEASTTVCESIELLNLEEFLTMFDTEAEALRERAA